MKKILLLALSMFVGHMAMAQGTVQFQNNATTAINTNVNGVIGKATTAANQFNYLLLWGTVANGIGGVTNVAGAAVANSTTAAGVIPAGSVYAVSGTQAGDTVLLEVLGYSAIYGTDFRSAALGAQGGLFGHTAILPITLGPTAGPGSVIWSSSDLTKFQGFQMIVVPEPSTIALGALGVSSLLLFRRRK